MRGNCSWQKLLFSCFAFSSVLPVMLTAGPPSTSHLDSSWKRYSNPQSGFCVSYPARWHRGDAFDGSGLYVESGPSKKLLNPVGEIDVAAIPGSAASASQPRMSFVEDVQVHLEGLRKFERAQQMEILEQRPMDLIGNRAFFTKERYYDPLERAKWVDEFVFTQHGGVLYRLELECRADQLNRFEPVFTHLVSTFEFDCGASR